MRSTTAIGAWGEILAGEMLTYDPGLRAGSELVPRVHMVQHRTAVDAWEDIVGFHVTDFEPGFPLFAGPPNGVGWSSVVFGSFMLCEYRESVDNSRFSMQLLAYLDPWDVYARELERGDHRPVE